MSQQEGSNADEIKSATEYDEQEQEDSQTDQEAKQESNGVVDEGNEDDGFKLEEDSQDEIPDYTPQEQLADELQDGDEQDGYGQEMLTETADDHYMEDVPYGDDYEASNQMGQTGQSNILGQILSKHKPDSETGSGSHMSRSLLTKQTGPDQTQQDFASLDYLASDEALAKLKKRIQQKKEQHTKVEPDEILNSLKAQQHEKTPLNNDRFDLFFRENKFLSDLREQTDSVSLHELYKCMTVKRFEAQSTVLRYGKTSDECFFVIKGQVKQLVSIKKEVEVKQEEDLIKFYADNFDDVIWAKIDEADQVKQMASLYRDDPNQFDFDVEKSHAKMPDRVTDGFEKTLFKLKNELSRPGSAYSHKSRLSSKEARENYAKKNPDSSFTKYDKAAKKGNKNHGSSSSFFPGEQSESIEDQGLASPTHDDCKSDATYTEDVWLLKAEKIIGVGETFGQSALIESNPCLVTYLCSEDCEIAVLNRESYQRIVEKAVKRDILGRIQFLKEFKIFSKMNQSQLEKLLYHVKLIEFNRGKTIYNVGDKPDGIYLIQEGGFELNRPGQLEQNADKIVQSMKIDPLAKFQLKKQAKVLKDNSRALVKLAILGSGEIFGLEECQVKPTSVNLKNRSYQVVCAENKSKAIFISHQIFTEKVLYLPQVEQAIKFDCALKEFFHNSRELQYQQTIWNGSLTSIKQIENAAEKAEADFDERLKRDNFGLVNPDMKGMPRLRTVDQFQKDKFEAEILNKIMGQITERTIQGMEGEGEDVQQMVKKKIKQIENHFDATINVINAERKQQKAKKQKLEQLKQIEKQHGEVYNMSVMASQALTSQNNSINLDSNMQFVGQQSYFQDSIVSSQADAMSPHQTSTDEHYHNIQGLSYHEQLDQQQPHYASVDHGKLQVIHSVVKQKQSHHHQEQIREDDELIDELNPQFMSADNHEISLKVKKRGFAGSVVQEQSEPSVTDVKESQKVASHFGLLSNTGETVAPLKSIVIDQQENMTPDDKLLPVTGDRSDVAVFRGLHGSQDASAKALGAQSQMEKLNLSGEKEDQKELGQSAMQETVTMNKTQNAFQTKDKNLLEMFNEGQSQNNDHDRKQKNATALNGPGSPADEGPDEAPKDGGIIVSLSKDPQGQIGLQISDSTKLVGKEQIESGEQDFGKNGEMQIKEGVSDTTGNPSQMGNVSSIRDPRYSQEQMLSKQGLKGLGKKLKGLQNNRQADNQAAAIGLNQQIKVPKVFMEKTDENPIYQEGEELKQSSDQIVAESLPPVINITTRNSRGLPLSDKPMSGEQSVRQQESKHQEQPLSPHRDQNFKVGQGNLGSELPFNHYVNKSGLKGAKRNQLSYVSKTINDKSLASKLRIINKDSTHNIPSAQMDDALQNIGNSFTADMPEMYTEVYSQSLNPNPQYRNQISMFPTINQSMNSHRNQSLVQDSFMKNADISMIDTAQFSNNHASPMSPGGNVMRIVESHQSNQPQREIFVPSQINPRMKRQTGKAVAERRLQQMRGASAKSYQSKAVKSRHQAAQRGHTNVPRAVPHQQQFHLDTFKSGEFKQAVGAYGQAGSLPLSPNNNQEMTDQSRNQTFDQTGNSYAKQMQNPDDTQYRAAMMREARQQQMMIEAARAASQQREQEQQQQQQSFMDSEYERNFGTSVSPFNLSPAAAAAASELIQRFVTNPGEPISTEHFLHVQRKYELPPFEAYQLLLQQIQFQKALLTPPTAATVIKVSHNSYTSAVRDKREEVINFRNDLFKRYTYRKRASVSSKKIIKGKTTAKTSAGMQTTQADQTMKSQRSKQ